MAEEKNNQAKQEQQQDIGQLLKVRREKLAVLQEENAALHQELEETRTSLQRARKINSHFMARDKRERRKVRVSEAEMAAPDAEMLPEYFGWPNDVKR